MADTKISALTTILGSAIDIAADLVPVVDTSATTTKAILVEELFKSPSITLVTPILGVAAATSINKVAITAPAASATLTIPDGLTLNAGPGGTLTALAFTTPGTGVATALGVNVGSAGAFVVLGGALGTPSSGTLTSATGLPAAGVVGTAAILGANSFTGIQTITPAINAKGLIGGNVTHTADSPFFDIAQTWNNVAVTFTGWKLNITDTTSAAGSLLVDLQVGGASKYQVKKTGALGAPDGGASAPSWYFIGDAQTGFNRTTTNTIAYSAGGTNVWKIGGTSIGSVVAANMPWGWVSGTIDGSNIDTYLTRAAPATVQHGAANAAAPVAQTVQAQGSRSGTDSNVGGANYTITSGNGTGTGTVSTLILQSPIAVASGTGAQTQTTGLTLKVGTAVLTSYTVANLPAAATAGAGATAFVTDASTTLILGLGGTVTGGGANKVPVFSDGTNWIYG